MDPRPSLEQRILYEDNHLVIVNKLPSEIVQGDKTGDIPLSEAVKTYLKKKYNKPGNVFLGVIHRLDRPVSGAVVFSRTGKALSRMNALIKSRQIGKTYWAIVKQPPPDQQGVLHHHLVRDASKNKSFVSKKPTKESKEAILTYRLVAESRDYYLLEIDLKTGRHHQIRAQLAAIGCPIKGDLKYGYPRSNRDASIHLHARSISFEHPVKNTPVSIIAAPPKDSLWDFFSDCAQTL